MPTIVDLDVETLLSILLELDIRDLLVCERVHTMYHHNCENPCTDTVTLIMHHRLARSSEISSAPARCSTSFN